MANIADEFSYSLWLDRTTWSTEQACLLFSGLDPDLDEADGPVGVPAALLCADVDKWRRLVEASRISGRLEASDCSPLNWINWATVLGLELPIPLLNVIRRKELQPLSNSGSDKKLRTKKVNSYLKVILALIDEARLDTSRPTKVGNSLSAALKDKYSLELEGPTITKHLKSALDLKRTHSQ